MNGRDSHFASNPPQRPPAVTHLFGIPVEIDERVPKGVIVFGNHEECRRFVDHMEQSRRDTD